MHSLEITNTYLDCSWYIYYTAGNSADLAGQRPHVLKGKLTSTKQTKNTR